LFKCLGMTYYWTLNITALSEHAAIPMLAAAHQICGFVQDAALCDRPFTSLWLAKAYVVPAGAQGSCAKVIYLGLPYKHCI